jgi:uncharacterized membrane protein HdeD (DUF308 family)
MSRKWSLMSNSTAENLIGAEAIWWLFVLFGVVMLGVGVFFVVSPHETLSTFTVIAGIFLLLDGVIVVLSSIFGDRENRGLLALLGVISVVAGLVLLKKPFATLVVLALIFGVWFIVAGGVRLVASFAVREDRAVNVFVSLLEIGAGIVVLSWPEIGLATLAVIIGIVLILRGFLFTVVGLQLHRHRGELSGSSAISAP